MTPRAATIFLLWYGEKAIAGHEPTQEEFETFKQARQVSLSLAHRIMRIKPDDYAYIEGQPYKAA